MHGTKIEKRKMTIEILKITYKPSKIISGPFHKLKIIKKNHELKLIRPQTQHKYPEHMYLKFLTPLTPSVEKIVKLHGSKYY